MIQKRLVIIFLCLAALAILPRFVCWHGSSFCLHKIQTPLKPHSAWETAPHDAGEALQQRYFYLGNGAQSYAFVSEDGRYVIKFFKMKHLLPKSWLKAIPLPFLDGYRAKKVDLREKRLRETFGAFKMAYEEFKEESGLLLVHLNPTENRYGSISLVREEKRWQVDLDSVPFVLQERAELIYKRLERLARDRDQEGLKRSLDAALSFFVLRDKKGFIDQDSGVSGNFGFVGERVIQIDVGRLQRKEGASIEELELATRAREKLQRWKESHKICD